MTFLSASDDFVYTSLGAVPGTLGKLRYVAGLQQENGGYAHWGLARLHGEAAAQRVAAESHRSLFLQVLRTPLRELLEEARRLAAEDGDDVATWLEKLNSRPATLLPAEPGGGCVRHFSFVLAALSSLSRSAPASIPRAA